MLRGSCIFRAPKKRPHQNDDNNESAIPVDTSPIYATVKKLKGRSERLSHTHIQLAVAYYVFIVYTYMYSNNICLCIFIGVDCLTSTI